MNAELIVFDLDGTLIDSRADIAASTNRALERVGLPPRTEEEISRFVGEGARKLIERAVAPRAEKVDGTFAAFMEDYGKNLVVRTRLYDGIAGALASLERPLAIATNKPGRFARRILVELGVADRFLAVLGGDEAPRKPDAAVMNRLAALVGSTAARAVLVGDSKIDVATARAAGARLVAVTWGFGSREELVAAGARDDEMVGTVDAMVRALRA